jgi:uncharacterized protein
LILKILAVIAVLFFVYILFFKKRRVEGTSDTESKKHNEIEDILVECPSCGTFVSKDEAILSNGKYYCSNQCLGK